MASMHLGAPMQSGACKNQLVMQFSTFGEFDLELQLDAESLQITSKNVDSISEAFPKVIQLHPEDPAPPLNQPGTKCQSEQLSDSLAKPVSFPFTLAFNKHLNIHL